MTRRPSAEYIAGFLTLVAGAPMIYLLAVALADGQARADRAPLAWAVGSESLERLSEGEGEGLHYLAPESAQDRLRAPDFRLSDREGRPWRLSDHRGKVVVLNFWSITCGPCVEEMPSLVQLGRMIEGRGDVELVTISTDASWREVAPLFQRVGSPPFEVLFDPGKEVVQGKFGTKAYPETWFIDPDGIVRLRVDGPRDWSSPIVLDLIDRWG